MPLSEAELTSLTQLVRDAVGYDQARGDSVSVINSAFVPAGDVTELPEVPFWTQPWFWNIAKQALGILFVLVLVFGVLRPVLKSLSGGNRDAAGESGGYPALNDDGLLADDLRDDTVSLSAPASGPVLLPPPGAGYEQQLNAIKGLLAEDPGRVAQVVKEWINADE